MDEVSDPGVAEVLRQNGLEGPAFDVAAIAEALAGWREASRELDRLLDGRAAADVTAFDPEWR